VQTCKSIEHYTPTELIRSVKHYFDMRGLGGIRLDPATAEDNPTDALIFYTKETNGLDKPWINGTFVNPPYGREIRDWVAKILQEVNNGIELVALMPCSRSEQAYWQKLWNSKLTGDVQIRKRQNFLHRKQDECVVYTPAKGNPYSSQLLCYNGTFNHCVKAFRHLGTCKAYKMIVEGPA